MPSELNKTIVLPRLSRQDLVQIVRAYGCGDLKEFRAIPKGVANRVYAVKTTTDELIVKLPIRNGPEAIGYEIALLNHLHDLPTPAPLKAASGAALVPTASGLAFGYRRLHGRHRSQFSPEMISSVGRFLGSLHCQTRTFRSRTRRFQLFNLQERGLTSIIDKCRTVKDPVIERAIHYIANSQAELLCLPDTLPKGAIHADVKPENALFIESSLTGIIDFDNAYNGPFLVDLARAMILFCTRGRRFDSSAASLLKAAYEEERKLTGDERLLLLRAIHFAYLSHVLVDVEYFARGQVPRDYVHWGIGQLLPAQAHLDDFGQLA